MIGEVAIYAHRVSVKSTGPDDTKHWYSTNIFLTTFKKAILIIKVYFVQSKEPTFSEQKNGPINRRKKSYELCLGKIFLYLTLPRDKHPCIIGRYFNLKTILLLIKKRYV